MEPPTIAPFGHGVGHGVIKMKAARLAIMGVALAAGGGAGFMALNLFGRNSAPETVEIAAPQIASAEVLVAAKDMPPGTSLKEGALSWQKWPADSAGAGFILRSDKPDAMEEFNDAITRSAFFQGEPIREGKLVRSDRGYMSAILPAGQRAVATTISTETSAGGFILPNDRVDVIMTRRQKGDEGEEFVTETILENIRVLAIDQTIEEKDGEQVVVGETATLQLAPRQAEVLTVAQQMADRLTLTLRSIQDSKSEETSAAEHLLGGVRGKGSVRTIKYGAVKDIATVATPVAR